MKKVVLIGVFVVSLLLYGCGELPSDQVKTDSLDYRAEVNATVSTLEPDMLNSGLPI